MLRVGWGTVYEQVCHLETMYYEFSESVQAGAEYGERGKEEFLRVEAEAKYVLVLFRRLDTHLLILFLGIN